jgi:hypothetical protein
MPDDQIVVPGETAGDPPKVTTPAAAGSHHADHADEIHMPPNSWWPLIASLGATFTMLGLAVTIVLTGLGLVILVVGVGGWIMDARKEYQELH